MKRRALGFTLIEVLVVLTIVGLMAAVLSLNVSSLQGRDDERELRRLRLGIDASSERAEVGGTPVAIELLSGGYRFVTLDFNGNWQLLIDPPIFVERRLPADWRWVELQQAARFPGSETRLLFGDEPSEFRLRVMTPGGEVQLLGDSGGRVSIVMPNGKVS